jgi:two-component system NarL family response regulator
MELVLGLRTDIEVIGAVEDGAEAASVARELAPDVVVMDYRLPGMDGVEATAAVRAACPRAAVVCLTAEATQREKEALYDAGVVACVTKDDELDEIVGAIYRAAAS